VSSGEAEGAEPHRQQVEHRDRSTRDSRLRTHLDDLGSTHHDDDAVRTTFTLDSDVVRLIEEKVHRLRKPFKVVVNNALRRGLAPQSTLARYRVRAHVAHILPGLDGRKLNTLANQFEEGSLVARLRKRPAR